LNKFLHVNKTAIPEAVRINILTDIAKGENQSQRKMIEN